MEGYLLLKLLKKVYVGITILLDQYSIYAATINILDNLYENFRGFRVDNDSKTFEHTVTSDMTQTERISRIVNFIYDNYPYKITLDQIADNEHLNKFYLSHLFSHITGQSFKNFLCMVRVEMSERALLSDDVSITQLAMDSGFSKPHYYIEHFIKWYDMHPKEYRSFYRLKTLEYVKPAVTEISIDNLNVMMNQAFDEPASPEKSETLKTDIDLRGGLSGGDTLKGISVKINEYCLNDAFLNDIYLDFHKNARNVGCIFENKNTVNAHESISKLYSAKYDTLDEISVLVRKVIKNKKTSIPFFDSDEALGMVTANGLIKPSYYPAVFMAELKGNIIYSDEHGFITSDGDNYSWIFFNATDGSTLSCNILFALSGGPYKLTLRMMESCRTFYDSWKELGLGYDLERKDKVIINQCTSIRSKFKRIAHAKQYSETLSLKQGSVIMGTLERS